MALPASARRRLGEAVGEVGDSSTPCFQGVYLPGLVPVALVTAALRLLASRTTKTEGCLDRAGLRGGGTRVGLAGLVPGRLGDDAGGTVSTGPQGDSRRPTIPRAKWRANAARGAHRHSKLFVIKDLLEGGGGESGIRTHGRVSPTHAFQACSFNRSDISPERASHGLGDQSITAFPHPAAGRGACPALDRSGGGARGRAGRSTSEAGRRRGGRSIRSGATLRDGARPAA